jgi:hypothetical protein
MSTHAGARVGSVKLNSQITDGIVTPATGAAVVVALTPALVDVVETASVAIILNQYVVDGARLRTVYVVVGMPETMVA